MGLLIHVSEVLRKPAITDMFAHAMRRHSQLARVIAVFRNFSGFRNVTEQIANAMNYTMLVYFFSIFCSFLLIIFSFEYSTSRLSASPIQAVAEYNALRQLRQQTGSAALLLHYQWSCHKDTPDGFS